MRFRVQHARAKLFATALALALYLSVYLDQEHESVLALPLVVERAGGGSDSSTMERAVRVRIAAHGRTLARLRIAGVSRSGMFLLVRPGPAGGEAERTLQPEDVVVPLDLEVRVLEIVDPKKVVIESGGLAEREVPVHVPLVGNPAMGHAHSEDVEIVPAAVLVVGPAALLDSLRVVETDPLDLAERTQRFEVALPLRPPTGLTTTPREVIVTVDVEKTAQLELGVVPVVVRNARRYEVRPVPAVVRLSLIGPESRLAAIAEHHRLGEETGLTVMLDASGLGPGAHELSPRVELPARLQLLAVEPPKILLHILASP